MNSTTSFPIGREQKNEASVVCSQRQIVRDYYRILASFPRSRAEATAQHERDREAIEREYAAAYQEAYREVEHARQKAEREYDAVQRSLDTGLNEAIGEQAAAQHYLKDIQETAEPSILADEVPDPKTEMTRQIQEAKRRHSELRALPAFATSALGVFNPLGVFVVAWVIVFLISLFITRHWVFFPTLIAIGLAIVAAVVGANQWANLRATYTALAKATANAQAMHSKCLIKAQESRALITNETDDRHAATLRRIDDRKRAQLERIDGCHQDKLRHIEADFQTKLAQLHEGVKEFSRKAAMSSADWSDPAWVHWVPSEAVPSLIARIGELKVHPNHVKGLSNVGPIVLPILIPFASGRSLILHAKHQAKLDTCQALLALMMRLLATIPPGKVRFTMIDPVGLGNNFSALMHLADDNELLVTAKVWTEQQHIEQRLADLTEHMESVIQKYLRNQYATIEDFNREAGEVAEPYRVLAIANFPVNFTETAARRLLSIVTNGPRCGVYTLMTVDGEHRLPHDFNLADLTRTSTNIIWEKDHFVWHDEDFQYCHVTLDAPPLPALGNHIVQMVGACSKGANRIEVPFQFIAPEPEMWWKHNSRPGISIPIGKADAKKQQKLELGDGTAQHVLIAGRTGSGKSTLFHALITNLALNYSPKEVELYLVDFKTVEFKAYAEHQLPHARVVAVESEREFGVSVLLRLDVELKHRQVLFKKHGVQTLTEYRDAQPNAHCPRILLMVDEFQEFFVEDDQFNQQATLLLDRLVRQGRGFGIHVLLGSQTLAGTYTPARSTIDQMGVRIALLCSDADARLILSDENSLARLLSRPGEAIYNDKNGLVEGNNRFQIVLLKKEQRDDYLTRIREVARQREYVRPEPLIVFDGNAPADIGKNELLNRQLRASTWPGPPKATPAWLGEPVAIVAPTAATFRRQSGNNLIIVGQHDEAALGLLLASIVALAAHYAPNDEHDRSDCRFYILDYGQADSSHAGLLSSLGDVLPHRISVPGKRGLTRAISELASEIEQRLGADDTVASPYFLIIHGLQRARELRRQDNFPELDRDSEAAIPGTRADEQFATILRDGPDLGIHTIISCDTMTNLIRTLGHGALTEFKMRVGFQMAPGDSSNLLDEPVASKLGPHRAFFYDDEEGRLEKFRPYGLPGDCWLAEVKNSLHNKRRGPKSTTT